MSSSGVVGKLTPCFAQVDALLHTRFVVMLRCSWQLMSLQRLGEFRLEPRKVGKNSVELPTIKVVPATSRDFPNKKGPMGRHPRSSNVDNHA